MVDRRRHDYDAILDRWARNDAAAAIAADLGMRNYDAVIQAVIRARRAGDQRAIFHSDPTREIPRRKTLTAELGIVPRSVIVTTLGAGSHQCARVPVSVTASINMEATR